ncbi:MAG: DUF58 domain-containing protein [Dehalococcoidales bacterium]|nr:DUF58 domain-containing protein [Dehalococcoidales bacterium]
MINLHGRGATVTLKAYPAAVLLVAAAMSSALSFIPVLPLIWYMYVWRWSGNAAVNLLTSYFMFFAIVLLFTPHVNPVVSSSIPLPVLWLFHQDLKEAAVSLNYRDTGHTRRPTGILFTLILIVAAVLVVSLLLGSVHLVVAGSVVTTYLVILGTVVLRRVPLKPVQETQVYQRIVAGTKAQLRIELTAKTKTGGLLFLKSPYEWLKVSPDTLSMEENRLLTEVTLSPSLSGPSLVKLKGQVTDVWGLFRTSFDLEPVRLHVIPRAKYAAWLVNRYLARSKSGTLPLISNMAAQKPMNGLRRGIEYYGSQMYQPGDSLKNIDWKHSLKHDEMISKEFAEFQGQSAIILINLSVGDAEDKDRLAHDIIVTALSLAQENIPAALAAYTHEEVKLTTAPLQPRQLLPQSLQIAQQMVAFINPQKYLHAPDVTRLRANISRLKFSKSQASEALVRILQLEYNNISNNARTNPATRALTEAFGRADKKSNVVIISQRNHDAEALEFNAFSLAEKGTVVIAV